MYMRDSQHLRDPKDCQPGTRESQNTVNSKKRIFREAPKTDQSNFQSNQPSHPQTFVSVVPVPPSLSRFVAPKHLQIDPSSIPPNPSRTSQPVFTQPLNFQRQTMFKPPSQRGGDRRSINKLTTLARMKYINPLARLQYQDREMEVYTKISRQSQQYAIKKIKAKNQLATFDDDPIDEQKEIDDLIEFKLGKTGKNGFMTYFQQEETLQQQRLYCSKCQAFVAQNLYEQHSGRCVFQYSKQLPKRMEQISTQINALYKLVLEQDDQQECETVKNLLMEANSRVDKESLNLVRSRLRSIRVTGDLQVLVLRTQEIIKVKLDSVS